MYQTCCFLNKNGICFVPYSMQSKPQLYKDSSPCRRCSFVKCESGNDLKWKEINRMLPSKLWKVVLLEIGSTALQMVSQPLRWMVSFFLMVFLDYLCSLAQGAISWSDSMEVVSYIEVVYNIGVSCLLTINRQYIHLLI